jgi:hypothetical protein
MKIADHEADAKGKVEALEDPDGPHQDHGNTDQAADNAHHDIECGPHGGAPFDVAIMNGRIASGEILRKEARCLTRNVTIAVLNQDARYGRREDSNKNLPQRQQLPCRTMK